MVASFQNKLLSEVVYILAHGTDKLSAGCFIPPPGRRIAALKAGGAYGLAYAIEKAREFGSVDLVNG
jgi:hypothetical protein